MGSTKSPAETNYPSLEKGDITESLTEGKVLDMTKQQRIEFIDRVGKRIVDEESGTWKSFLQFYRFPRFDADQPLLYVHEIIEGAEVVVDDRDIPKLVKLGLHRAGVSHLAGGSIRETYARILKFSPLTVQAKKWRHTLINATTMPQIMEALQKLAIIYCCTPTFDPPNISGWLAEIEANCQNARIHHGVQALNHQPNQPQDKQGVLATRFIYSRTDIVHHGKYGSGKTR